METELENFSPRHSIVGYGGPSKSWSSFVRGKDGVRRITASENGAVLVEFESGDRLRILGATDAWGLERKAEVPAIVPPPKPAVQPMQKQGARR